MLSRCQNIYKRNNQTYIWHHTFVKIYILILPTLRAALAFTYAKLMFGSGCGKMQTWSGGLGLAHSKISLLSL